MKLMRFFLVLPVLAALWIGMFFQMIYLELKQ